jgi:mRNA deadenylase 3'-5' endonuclease subunit Ccr4
MNEPSETQPSNPDNEFCEVVDQFGVPAVETFCEPPAGSGSEEFRWIRLERGIDSSLESVLTKQDVLEQIQATAETQAKVGDASLVPRRWKRLTEGGSSNTSCVVDGNSSSFTVMQFNILAEGLSSGPHVTPPFVIEPGSAYGQGDKNGTYGGFSDVSHAEVALDFSLRKWRLLEAILGKDGEAPMDIIAMEEVDRFYGFFAPLMRLFGYEGLFAPKVRSPSVHLGWYSDGCALFWKTDKFELISEDRHEYKVGNQVMLMALLKHHPTGQHMLVANTHLKAQKSVTSEKIRCFQVDELRQRIQRELSVIAEAPGIQNVPVLVMGDFNADPPLHTEAPRSAIQSLIHPDHSSSDEEPVVFRSVYPVDPPPEDFYTTWKTRGTKTAKRIIDYIFYSGDLDCTAYLEIPTGEELGSSKLPSLRYPSDHMAIAAKFELKQ